MSLSVRLARRPEIARVRGALEAHNRAARALGRLTGNVVGTAIVLACVVLPLWLEEWSRSMQQATTDEYIRALREAGGSPTTVVPGTLAERPELLDQHYYFVSGCVAAPGVCAGADPDHWGEYYAELRTLYDGATQPATCKQTFDEWAAAHAHFIVSETAAGGARSMEQALSDNPSNSDVHVLGTSAGGAAVFTYLSQAMRGDVPFDRRIRSVMTVDSPLGYEPPFTGGDLLIGLQAGSMKTDVEPGIGAWARAAGIAMLTIDTVQDIVGYDPVPDVPNDAHPIYRQSDIPPASAYVECGSLPCQIEHMTEHLDLGSVWHVYTGSHMADSAKQFVDEHWR